MPPDNGPHFTCFWDIRGTRIDRSPDRSTITYDNVASGMKFKKQTNSNINSIQQSNVMMNMKTSKITDFKQPHSQISPKKHDSNDDGNSTLDEDDWLDNELKEYNYKLYSQIL